MQSIGTQTLWQRDLQISGNFDVIREKICVDQNNQITTIGTEAKCTAADDAGKDGAGGRIDGAKAYTWVENPNYVNIPVSLKTGVKFSTDMITAKPGDANTGEASAGAVGSKGATRRIQANAIKQLIDSLDPKTYLIDKNASYGAAQKVRKRFTNAPQESWDMKTGAWSYSISWIYEMNDPWAFPSADFLDPNLKAGEVQDDGLDIPYPGQIV